MRPRKLLPLVAVAALTLAACGSGGDENPSRTVGGTEAARSVDVEMADIAFKPAALAVTRGETVTFRFTNRGAIPHDAFIGDRDDQMDHEKRMTSGGHDAHGGDNTAALTVAPGQTATLTHTFPDAGALEIGCHQPGHYAAGMTITVTVT